MQWSPEQDAALKSVDDWFRNHSKQQQVYRLFGWAGTGKTTLAVHFAKNIEGLVLFAAYTGKAAHVMASKGCMGASTIHKLIYRPKVSSNLHLKKLEEKLQKLLASEDPTNEIAKLKNEIIKEKENAGRMSFSLNLESELRHAKLLIIDEVSMVNEQVGKDLESFGIPILVLGDPEQLPPIYGAGYFIDQKPDFQLMEIHRQALDNPIIAMSKLVREDKPLSLGTYGSSRVINEKLDGETVLSHDIILTGLRRTKKACDDKARQLLGYTSSLPVQNDKLICVRNDYLAGLLNGQMWTATQPAQVIPNGIVSLHISDGDTAMSIYAVEKLFYGQPISRWEREGDLQEFEYAYAITVHKAQGSQWNNVLLYDQRDKFNSWTRQNRRRWLYTGITRAAEKITIIRPL